MNSPLRFGIIGGGRMGRVHTARLHADGRAQVTAVFDQNPEAAAQLQSDLAPAATVYGSFHDLLNRAELDAVVICTPTTAHFDQVRSCRQQGWHVLCEKPLADTRRRILTLIEESRNRRPRLSVAYQRRYWSTYRTLRRELQSGRWGAIRAITSTNTERWQPTIPGTWRDNPAINIGGFVGDAGSHKLDALFYVTGPTAAPAEVFAHSERAGSQVEVVTTVSARLADGVPLSMSFVGNAHHLGEDLHIHCTEADLMIRQRQVWIARQDEIAAVADIEPDSNPTVGFVEEIVNDGPTAAPASCALPVFDFTMAILESARTGAVVRRV